MTGLAVKLHLRRSAAQRRSRAATAVVALRESGLSVITSGEAPTSWTTNLTDMDAMAFDLEGNQLAGIPAEAYSERFIHARAYKARPEVKAVVHAHTRSLVMMSVSGLPLKPVTAAAAFAGAPVPMVEGTAIHDIPGGEEETGGPTLVLATCAERARRRDEAIKLYTRALELLAGDPRADKERARARAALTALGGPSPRLR